jgi:hypothetical protein
VLHLRPDQNHRALQGGDAKLLHRGGGIQVPNFDDAPDHDGLQFIDGENALSIDRNVDPTGFRIAGALLSSAVNEKLRAELPDGLEYVLRTKTGSGDFGLCDDVAVARGAGLLHARGFFNSARSLGRAGAGASERQGEEREW